MAKGLHLIDRGTCSITANTEIILSAGAFHTTTLLEFTAVGELIGLRDLDIAIVIENDCMGGEKGRFDENCRCVSIAANSLIEFDPSILAEARLSSTFLWAG